MVPRLPSATSRSAVCSIRRCLKTLESRTQPSHPLRCQYQQRTSYSTSPPPPPPQPATEPSRPTDLRSQFQPPNPNPDHPYPRPKRSLRPYIYATLFFMCGVIAGQATSLLVAPPPLPAPGSKEDKMMIEVLRNQAEKLPIVESLSTDPNWTSYDATAGIQDEHYAVRLTGGTLAGARAIGGFRRAFYHKETGENVTVIWFGGAVSGWPGIVHGGVQSTILDEALGRCAVRFFPTRTGVTANLEVDFLKPVLTNAFYIVRAIPTVEGRTERKSWVSGRLESLDGRVLAEAKGLFVVPKKFKLNPIPDNV